MLHHMILGKKATHIHRKKLFATLKNENIHRFFFFNLSLPSICDGSVIWRDM